MNSFNNPAAVITNEIVKQLPKFYIIYIATVLVIIINSIALYIYCSRTKKPTLIFIPIVNIILASILLVSSIINVLIIDVLGKSAYQVLNPHNNVLLWALFLSIVLCTMNISVVVFYAWVGHKTKITHNMQ
jgi:magnesium-transporting ATPase (P-type)